MSDALDMPVTASDAEWAVTLPAVRAHLNLRALSGSRVLFSPLSLSTSPLVNATHIIKSVFFWETTFQLLSLPDSLKKKNQTSLLLLDYLCYHREH